MQQALCVFMAKAQGRFCRAHRMNGTSVCPHELRVGWGKKRQMQITLSKAGCVGPGFPPHDGLLTKQGRGASVIRQSLRCRWCQVQAWESQGGLDGPVLGLPALAHTEGEPSEAWMASWPSSSGLSIYFSLNNRAGGLGACPFPLPTFFSRPSSDWEIQALGGQGRRHAGPCQ